MMTQVEKIADIITLGVIVAVFCMSAVAYFVPPRGISRLRIALSGLDLLIALIFGLSLLAQLGIHLHLPQPEFNWALRVLFVGFGVGKMVEMVRSGAYRRL
jgi:hypothetical protein